MMATNNDDVTVETSKSSCDWWKFIEGKLDDDGNDDAEHLMLSYKGNIAGHDVPNTGWKISLAHQFKFNPTYWSLPPLSQIPSCVGLSMRYLKYYWKLYNKKKRPCMDIFNQMKLKPIYGVPLGGIGCGTINRGWKGDFCRWQLKPGIYTYDIPSSDQFIVNIRKRGVTVWQQVLNPGKPSNSSELNTWNWEFDGTQAFYTGLYPRAWTVYHIPHHNITLTCRQISPVYPHDYKDTSLPVGVFAWNVENHGKESLDVTICLCMENGNGSASDRKRISGLQNKLFPMSVGDCVGVEMVNKSQYPAMPYTMNIAVAKKPGVECSTLLKFAASKNGADLWKPLLDNGCFPSSEARCSDPTRKGERIGSSVCGNCNVKPNSKSEQTIDFAISWDMPKIHFGDNGQTYKRRYTKWFGSGGDQGPHIAQYALQNYLKWEEEINKWQKPIIDNPDLPSWYKSAIFNELYYISDGGTVWVEHNNCDVIEQNGYAGVPDDTKSIADQINGLGIVEEYGRFAYLEGHEYKMYNTYDVHFYASTALAQLWPNLELSLQSDFAIGILQSESNNRQYLMNGEYSPAKTPNVVPHDLGCPDDEPWLNINTYFVHDTAEWKDLNPKFVLQIYRDFYITKNMKFLEAIYPVCKIIMKESMKHDLDGDGLIENNGGADQTFDGWFVTGPSAYCGGLWLAALRCMKEAAEKLNYHDDVKYYRNILEPATKAYKDRLWNGKYYNYDCSKNNSHRTSIMADQCAGQWYLSSAGITDVLPEEQIKSSLQTVFDFNVMKYDLEGKCGAVNGMKPNGVVDGSSVQSDEVWTGVTYSLSATMLHQGMLKEGFRTASGIYKTAWLNYGMAYQTPEAFRNNKTYRSLAYMRPLSIWAIQYAIEQGDCCQP